MPESLIAIGLFAAICAGAGLVYLAFQCVKIMEQKLSEIPGAVWGMLKDLAQWITRRALKR